MAPPMDDDSLPKASLAGFLFTALIITGLPMLLVPEADRSEWFWLRISWAEFLSFLVWTFLGGFFSHSVSSANTGTLGGMLPSFGVVVFLYAGVSMTVMLLHAWFEPALFSDRVHLAAQLIAFTLAGLVSVMLSFAIKSGNAGAEPIPRVVRSVAELVGLLTIQEERFSPATLGPGVSESTRELWVAIRNLIETLKYSLQHVGRIGTLDDYHALAADVESLFDKLDLIEPQGDDTLLLTQTTATVRDITCSLSALSAALKR